MKSPLTSSSFGSAFWCAYVANTALMIAVSIMFRYSDFVKFLGGTEFDLGWIVGVGMVGAIAMRVFQGAAIDRYGAATIWLVSVGLVLASLLAHLWVQRIDTPLIYLLRILYTISLASAFGSSLTFISLRAPAERTGEMIGAIGSSGFVGMALGPIVVDAIFRHSPEGRDGVDRMFLWASAMSLVALLAIAAAKYCGGERRRVSKRRSLPLWWLLRRYHPGSIMVIGVAMGLGIGIPFYFLRPFVEELGLEGIRRFFVVYASVAFIVRIACRQLPDRWGVRNTVILGMAFLTADMFSFLFVTNETWLMLPAALGGVAHAFVFPAALTSGSLAFPSRYRGLATTLMLTMFDVGNLVGQPAVGSLLYASRRVGWSPYPTMFSSVSVLMLAALVYYAWSTRRRRPGTEVRSRNGLGKDRFDALNLRADRESLVDELAPSHAEIST